MSFRRFLEFSWRPAMQHQRINAWRNESADYICEQIPWLATTPPVWREAMMTGYWQEQCQLKYQRVIRL